MNLSKQSGDKELFSGTIVKGNTDKVCFLENKVRKKIQIKFVFYFTSVPENSIFNIS